jgi:hypothetical protein
MDRATMHHPSKISAGMAAVLLLPSLAAIGGQSAATLYALNCQGCHFPSKEIRREEPSLVGQFNHTETGRVFYIRVSVPGDKPLDKAQEVRLLSEILNWKKSCPVILQDAPLLQYSGAR